MPAQLLTYRCPHCQHAIEVDPALAEQTVTCSNPQCGKPFHLDVPTARPERLLVVPPDIHERPREPEPIRPEDPAAGHAEVTPEAFGEKEVLTVQPVMFRRYPFRFLGYVLAIVVGLVGIAVWLLESWTIALGLLGIVLVVSASVRLLTWSLRNRTTSLTVTTKRLILKAGSLTSHTTEIPYKEITDVQVHQSLFNRLMKVGDITLATKMPDKRQILALAIPDPEDVATKIRALHQP
jgi:membrane protein YdbS with pleckstrin-like domain